MLGNYFKTAVRTLIKQRNRTFISLFSLVVGLTGFILLMLYARYELGYDAFFAHSDRIHRLGQYLPDWRFGGSNDFGSTSGIVAPTLKQEFPEVEYAVRTKEVEAPLVFEDRSVVTKGLYADRDFLKVFTFPLKAGDTDTALGEPSTVVLTESLSRRLFGGRDPVGRIVTYENRRPLKVTGVLADIPGNTHLRFEYLVSFLTMYALRGDIDTSWSILNYNSYLQLKDRASYRDLEAKLPAIVEKYHDQRSKNRRYFLIPVQNIHFETRVSFLAEETVDRKSVYLLISIAFLILVISCINYVNLAVARAGVRNKEVGVRKAVGATRRQLVRQFLGESFLLTFLGIGMSLAATILLFPAFRNIAGNGIPLGVLAEPGNLAALGGLVLAVGLLAGGYPALYLAGLKPLNVLKGSFGPRASDGQQRLCGILTVFQFGVTIVLVVAAAAILRQLRFIESRDIGYSRDNVVTVRGWNNESRENPQAIKRELLKSPSILAAGVANVAPLRATEVNDVKIESESGEMADLPMVTNYFIDEDYLGVMGMTLASGRNFSPDLAADIDQQVIINETAARAAGLKDPVGKRLRKWGRDMRIIGVVRDFHFTSFRASIEPLMFTYHPELSRMFLIKVAGPNIRAALDHIDATFRSFSRDFVFDYALMDDLYDQLYKSEGRLGKIVLAFSIMAMLIAGIGLYGLISFEVGRKTKEIGVRKILGASVRSVMGLILKRFFLLIAVAMLMALPLAYYVTHAWLKGFVYRIGLTAGLFAGPILLVLLTAVLGVTRLTLRAATANPALSLKRE
jgi:putative ABC transport system permease protein